MNCLGSAGKGYLLGQPKIARGGQVYRNPITIKDGFDNAGLCLECQVTFQPGASPHKTRKTPRPIPAHLSGAAVTVVKLPGAICFPGSGRDQDHDTICADATMPIANPDDLFASKTDFYRSPIKQNKVIARSVHFREFQKHAAKTYLFDGKIAINDANRRKKTTNGHQWTVITAYQLPKPCVAVVTARS